MTIAKQLVEAHGGQIGVDSRVGAAADYWFRLLVADVVSPVTISRQWCIKPKKADKMAR